MYIESSLECTYATFYVHLSNDINIIENSLSLIISS